jgi:hypothetical protein
MSGTGPQDRLGAAAGADYLDRQMFWMTVAVVALLIGALLWAAIFNSWGPF